MRKYSLYRYRHEIKEWLIVSRNSAYSIRVSFAGFLGGISGAEVKHPRCRGQAFREQLNWRKSQIVNVSGYHAVLEKRDGH